MTAVRARFVLFAARVLAGAIGLLFAGPLAADDPFLVTPASGGQAVFASGDVEMTTGARVDSVGLLATGGGRGKGHVVAGGTVRLSGKARVDGDVRCGPGLEVRKDGTASVSGKTGPLAEPPAPLSLDFAALEAVLATANHNVRIPRTSLGRPALSGPAGRTLVVGDGDRLDIPEGTYLLDALRLDGSAVVAARGRVRILVTGPVRLAGRSRLNPESGPFFLRLWSSGAELSLEGTSSVRAFVVAPRAAAILGGDTTLTGALRAASVRLEGQARVTRLVEDGSPLAAAFTESGQPLEDGAVFRRAVRPEAKPLPRVPVPEMTLLLDGASFRSGEVVSTAGGHRLLARLRDTWGRDAEPSVSFRVVLDEGEAPHVTIVVPAAGALFGASPVDVSGNAGTALSVDVNGVAASLSDGTFSARGVSLVEGANVLVATGRDAQGRVGTARSTVVLDTVPPAIRLFESGLILTDGGLFARAAVPVVSVVEAHPGTTVATLDGVPFVSGTAVPGEGSHRLSVVSEDRAGNGATRSVRFVVDTTPPALAITHPVPGSVVGTLPASLSGTCGDAVRVSSAGRDVIAANGTFTFPDWPFVEGRPTVLVTAVDAAGNEARATAGYVVDVAAPVVAISAPVEGAILGPGPIFVRGTATDSTLREVTVEGLPVAFESGGNFSAGPFSRPDGAAELAAKATDAAGRSSTATVHVTVDTVPPVVSVRIAATGALLVPGALLSTPPVLDVLATDATTPERTAKVVRVDGVPYGGGPVTGEGAHRVDVVATDGAGNVSTASIPFRLDTKAPAFRNVLPADGSVGRWATVTVSGNVSADAVSVTVNGLAASLAGGAFSLAGVALGEGANAVALRAVDGAGNAGTASLRLILDTTPPSIAFVQPAAGALVGTLSVAVSGTVSDANLDTVTVDGVGAMLHPGAFRRAAVPLVEGPNTLTATARDRAGNSTSTTVAVVADTMAPVIAIGSPVAGAIVGSSPTVVTGSAADPNLASVTVNGISASLLAEGRFSAEVPLPEGRSTLTAKARDAVGHEAAAGVVVTLDSAAPVVKIVSPRDGSRFRTTPQGVVVGLASLENLEEVTVNGLVATRSGDDFVVDVPLVEGLNPLTARARKTTGKEGTASATVTLDTIPPHLVSSVPADGQGGVPLSPEIRLTFSEELDAATVTPAALVLRVGGEPPIAVALMVDGAVVTVTPSLPLSDSRLYGLSLAASIADRAGNPLVPATVRFSTVDLTAPATPVLDPLPPLFCAGAREVTGNAEPGATVVVTGGAAVAQANVGADGRFTVNVPLRAETHQTLSVVARDAAGNVSPPATVSFTTDCTPPHVVDVVRTATDLAITFDEAVDPATLRSGDTVRLDETTGGGGVIEASLAPSADGLVLTVTAPGRDLGALAFSLALSSGVRDFAANALVPFVRDFAPLSVATVLVGELFDDATSRPLGTGSATLLAAGGAALADPLPRASVTVSGLFALPAIDGDALVRLSAPGYLDAWRRTTVVATAGTAPSETLFDARLTPVSPVATATPKDGGTLFTEGGLGGTPGAAANVGRVTLVAPAGSIPPGTVATLTQRSAQGLPVLPPLGWSVAGAAHVRLADAAGEPVVPSTPLTLSLPDRHGASTGTPLTLGRLDATGLVWIAEGTASLGEGVLEAFVSQTGDWAVFVPDPSPTSPPAPSPGAPLEGTILPASDPLEAATVVASPADVLASQTAEVSLTVSSPVPVPSGFPIQCLVTEELTLLDGSSVAAPSFLADLLLQRRGDGTTGLAIFVRASDAARRAALSIGWERFAVKKFPFEVRQGTVVTPAGGTVSGPSGWSLGMPAGAVAAPVSVTLTPLPPTDLPAAIPEQFTLLGSVRVGTGGATFSLPAALSVELAAPPPAGQEVLLVALEERSGLVVPRPVARAAWDEATSRLAMLPIDRALFPWPGVRGDGMYAFVASSEPLAFVSGRLFGLDGTPLPNLDVRAAGWPLVGVTEADGLFVLAIRALPETLGAVEPSTGDLAALTVTPPAPGAEIVGVELHIVVTPPWVTTVAPAPGAVVLVHSRFTVELSEPLDPLSITPESVVLAALTDGGPAVAVPAGVEASPGSRTVVVVPDAALPGNTSLVLTLRSTLRDLAGRGLVDRVTRLPADFVATFTTEDLTPPDGKPWLVTIGLPSGDPQTPTVEIVGGPGSVCPGCHVVAYNDTTQATASTDALSDGSFHLTLAARATDAIRIEIEKANGTKQTLPPVPFTGDGGRTAIVGTGGGTWQTPDGYRLSVPQGAFTAPVTVSTAALPQAGLDALVTPPRDVVWIDSFTLGMEADGQPATARAGFDLSFAAPPPGGATDQFLLAQVVEVLGERHLMVVDLLSRNGDRLVTDRSGEALQALARQGLATIVDVGGSGASRSVLTVVPGAIVRPLDGIGGGQFDRPSTFFDGVVKKGTYALYNTATLMAVVAGSFSGATLLATSSESDFVFAGTEVLTRNLYRLVTPAGRTFTLTLRDVDSGLALFQGEVTPGADPNQVTPVDPPIRPDPEPPAVLSASPAFVHRFIAPAAVLDGRPTDVATGIQAVTTFSGANVRVTFTGATGAAAPGARVRLQNVSLETGEPGVGELIFVTAGPDGSFPAIEIVAAAGDRLSLAVDNTDVPVGAPIVVRFDKLVKNLTSAAWGDVIRLTPTDSGARPLELRFEPEEIDGATRQVTAIPETPLERGRSYILSVEGAIDTGSPGKPMTARFEVGLGSPAPEPVATETTGFVRKVLAVGGLLFETGESNDIKVRDISRPPSGSLAGPCASVPLPGPGRDLALDAFGRLVCVGGGTEGFGFLKVFDILPGTGCANRLDEAGAAVVATQLGGDNAEYPAGGIPRRVSFHQPIERETWVAGRGNLPGGYTSGSPLGVRLPYDLSGVVPGGPDPLRPRMAKLTNVTTGESKTQRVEPGAALSLSLLRVSRGDLLALELGTFSIAVVDVLGYGLAIVDLEAVYSPGDSSVPSPTDPAQAAKLLLAYDGTSSGGGLPCQPSKCDVFQRCTASGPTCELLAAPPPGYDGLGLQPITSLVALADAVVVPKKVPDEEFRVVGALNGYGLAAFSVDLLARARPDPGVRIREQHVAGLLGHLPLKRAGSGVARAVGVAVATGMTRLRNAGACSVQWPPDSSGEVPPRDLAFVAAGENGVWVVDVSDPASMSIVGRLDTNGGALTVSVDARRKLLYVGDAGEGVSVFDVSDPCGETAEGLASDPRLVAVFQLGTGDPRTGVSNVPVEIDPDTGFAYAAANQTTGTAGLLGTYTLAAPPLYAVADTDQNGSFEVVSRVVPLGVENPSKESAFESVGIADPASDTPPWPPREDGTVHDAYVPDYFRVLAFLPGGAGATVEAEVTSTSPEGLDLFPTAPGFPKSGYTAERSNAVTLRRQGDDPAQPAFNRYLSDPIVVLADPRAQLEYVRTSEETGRPTFAGHRNPLACRNCDAAADVKDGLISEDASPAGPARRLELWSGDRIRLALAPSLKAQLPHLAEVDLRAAGVVVDSVRGDLTPGVSQRPRITSSLGVSDAGNVDLSSGELCLFATDLAIPGRGLDFAVERGYTSQALHAGALGRSWDSPLFERLRVLPNGNIDWYDGMGRRDTFLFDTGTRTLVAPPGVFATLVFGKDGAHYLTLPDRTVHRFDGAGRLVEVRDPVTAEAGSDGLDGNRIRLFHDSVGRPFRIVDALDHVIGLDYFERAESSKPGFMEGALEGLTDHTGRTVAFRYDPEGRLSRVLRPEIRTVSIGAPLVGEAGRPSTSYVYAEGQPSASPLLRVRLLAEDNVTTIRNGRGQETLGFAFADTPVLMAKEAVRVQRIGGKTATIGYEVDGGNVRAKVTDRRGTEWSFLHDPFGHLTETLLPVNSTTDPNTDLSVALPSGPVAAGPFKASIALDGTADGLPRMVSLPGGIAIERDFQVVSSPAARRSAANVRIETIWGSGGEASLVSTADYDSVTNSLTRVTRPGGLTTRIPRIEGKGLPSGVTQPSTFGIGPDGTPGPIPIASDYRYDDQARKGELRVVTDPAGVPWRLEYSQPGQPGAGYLERIERFAGIPTGTWHAFVRDERGNVVSETNARGVTSIYRVDEENRIVEETKATTGTTTGEPALNLRIRRRFDVDGNLVEERIGSEGNEKTRTYGHDALGRVISRVENLETAVEKRTAWEFDSVGNIAVVTDPMGAKEAIAHDARGLVVAVRRYPAPDRGGDPTSVQTYLRDEAGRVRERFNGVGSRTLYDYDEFGRQNLLVSPRGARTTWQYDGAGRPWIVETKDQSGEVRRHVETEYSPAGDVVRTTVRVFDDGEPGPRDAVTETAWDAVGRAVEVTDPLMRKTHIRYDDSARTVTSTDPFGNRVIAGYDGNGNRVSERLEEKAASGDPEPAQTRTRSTAYDSLDRPWLWTDELGRQPWIGLDLFGRVVKSVDAANVETDAVWDLADRLVERTDDAGTGRLNLRTTYEWNRWDLLERQTDAREAEVPDPAQRKSTCYVYDGLGRLVTTTWADGSSRTATWNPDGTLFETVDERGNRITHVWGPDLQLSRANVERAGGTTGFTFEEFAYDDLGRGVDATTDAGAGGEVVSVSRSYDSRDLVVAETLAGRGLAHVYDLAGKRVRSSFPEPGKTIARYFDVRDVLSKLDLISEAGTVPVATFTPFGFDRTSVVTRPFGVSTSLQYDAGARLKQLSTASLAAPGLLDLDYGLGVTDLVRSEQRLHEGGVADVFEYDAVRRLRSVGLGQVALGVPDPASRNHLALSLGRVHTVDGLERRLDGVPTVFANSTTPRHQYDQFADRAVANDLTGNRTSDSRSTYSWDARGRLVSAISPEGAVVDFGYDALGRRLSRTVAAGGTSTTNQFIYDGFELIQEWSCASGCTSATAYQLAREYVPSEALDRPLELWTHPADGPPEGRRFALFGNASGSIVALTDDQGRPVERVRYLPFGQPVFDTPISVLAISGAPNGVRVDLRYAIDTASASDTTVRLYESSTGADVSASVVAEARALILSAPGLTPGTSYRVTLSSDLHDAWGGGNGADITVEFAWQPDGELHRAADYALGRNSMVGLTRLWHGLEYEPVLGLYYVRHRWYDPESGAFLSPDPLGFPDGANQFSWPGANWWNQDPWGLYGWGDFRKDVTDTAKSYYGFLSQAALEGNPVYQLYNTVNTAKALAGRTKELYRKGGASAVADAAITDVASSLPIVNTVRNASRIVDTYENQGAVEGGRQVFRTTKAAATDVAAVYGIGKAATLPEPSTSIMPPEGWRFDGATPARRPTWQESEQFFGDELKDFGFRSQVAFKNGEEVAPSVTGSVRPDHSSALVRLAVEIKNYNISTPKGRRDLVRRIGKQVALRSVELPPGTRQGIIIDARGQTIAPGVLEDLEGRISARTRGVISPDNIYVQQ